MNKVKAVEIVDKIATMFPDATCELNYSNLHELVFAVLLSAQTTDKSVNNVTKTLFNECKELTDYVNADLTTIEQYIRAIGLYRNKAKNLKAAAEMLINTFNSEVPSTINELVKLPGVGRKTANVVLAEGFGIPAFAVDTHVKRVSVRLGMAKKSHSPDEIEQRLKKLLPKERWIKLHHQFIFFGRYHCIARSPKCSDCILQENCLEFSGKIKY